MLVTYFETDLNFIIYYKTVPYYEFCYKREMQLKSYSVYTDK